MVFVLTYPNIQIQLPETFQRFDDSFVNAIPMYTMIAQRRVARDFKILGTKIFVNYILTPNNPLLQKPDRWLNNASAVLLVNNPIFGDDTFNSQKELMECSELWGNMYWPNERLTYEPKYYADLNYYQWKIFPTPDQAYPLRMGFFQFPLFIDDTDSTNFFTDLAPEVLWYAICLEMAIFIEDNPRIQLYQQQYDQAKAALTNEDKMRILDEFAVR